MASKTRFAGLGYARIAHDHWRFVTLEDGATVGPQYKTKAELLADLERFAGFYGFPGATPAPPAPSAQLNGIKATRVGETIFIPLPRELWRAVDGGCSCRYCSADRKPAPAFWDTLAVASSAQAAPGSIGRDCTWTVHAPEYHGATVKRGAT